MVMSDSMASPEKSPSVRVTYSGKRKKRRESMSNDDQGQLESDQESVQGSPRKPVSAIISTSPPLPFTIPPVPPHVQVNVLSTPVHPPISGSTVVPSPIQVKSSSTSSVPPQSPHGSIDDGASEVGAKPRQRKKEGDRIQFLKDDPFCSELDPYNAFCTKCQNWIVLSPNRRYVMKNWITHRKSDCKIIPGQEDQTGVPTAKSEQSSHLTGLEDKSLVSPEALVPPTSSAPSATPASTISFPTDSKEMTAGTAARIQREQQRKARLEADPLTAVVHEHEVQCKLCHVWVKLGTSARYSVARWTDHREKRCRVRRQSTVISMDASAGDLPPPDVDRGESDAEHSSDVEPRSDVDEPLSPQTMDTVPGKLKRDPQVLEYNGTEIKCRYCFATQDVDSDLDATYDRWQKHKEHCAPARRQSRLSSFTFWIPSFLTSADRDVSSNSSGLPDQQTAQSSTWLSKLWPYGRSADLDESSGPFHDASGSGSTLSRKRGREDDEEGNAKQNERVTRPRYDSSVSAASSGIWQRLSTSVAGLVDGMRAGYAAAASSSTPMEEDARLSD